MKNNLQLKNDILTFWNRNYTYRRILKKSGGFRNITSLLPHAEDEIFIRGIAAQLNEVPIHPRAIAYKKGKSYVPEVAKHAKLKYHYKFDFSDFFGSFILPRLFDLGLHKMFSRAEFMALIGKMRGYSMNSPRAFALGQGAPSSPALTNIIMHPFDRAFNNKLNLLVPDKKDIIYTRYADDILVSTNYNLELLDIQNLIVSTLEQQKLGFLRLNESKTRKLMTGGKTKFLGITITADNKISTGAGHRRSIIKNFKQMESTRSNRLHLYEPWQRMRGMLNTVYQARYSNSIVENKINWEAHIDNILAKTRNYNPAYRNNLLQNLEALFTSNRYILTYGYERGHRYLLAKSKKLRIRAGGKTWEIT